MHLLRLFQLRSMISRTMESDSSPYHLFLSSNALPFFIFLFFLLEIEIRIVEINDKSEPFANRLRVRICTVWSE